MTTTLNDRARLSRRCRRLGMLRIIAAVVAAGFIASCFERGGSGSARSSDPAPDPGAGDRHPVPTSPASLAPIHRAKLPVDTNATLHVRLEAEPAHLNALISGDGLAVRLTLGDVVEGLLCQLGPLDAVTPCLAERVTESADGLTWRFWLRPKVRFHDGSLLSTDDVVAVVRWVARAMIPTPLTADFDDLVSVSADGSRITMVFRGRRLDRRQAFARLPIVPAKVIDTRDPSLFVSAPTSRAPIGTGPLAFVSWKPGGSITLRRFNDYWGDPSGAAEVHYHIVRSRERAYAMLRSGKLDLATQLPVAEALDVAASSDRVRAYTYDRPAYLAAVYNTRRDPMKTARTRRALTQLLDRQGVVDALLAGRSQVLAGPFVGPEVSPRVAALPFDRHAARSVFADSVAAAEILVPSESRTMARVADIWTADARGIATLTPQSLPFAAVLERCRAGEFDIALLAFTTGPNLDLYTRLHSSQIGGENYGGVAEPELDAALEAVRQANSPNARLIASHRTDELLAEIQPYAFISTDVRAGLVSTRVVGVDRGDGLAMRTLHRVSGLTVTVPGFIKSKFPRPKIPAR